MMDLNLKDGQAIKAILYLTLQNNIMLQVFNKNSIELLDSFSPEKANKMEDLFNHVYIETQEETLTRLKRMFGDIDDIDIKDAFQK